MLYSSFPYFLVSLSESEGGGSPIINFDKVLVVLLRGLVFRIKLQVMWESLAKLIYLAICSVRWVLRSEYTSEVTPTECLFTKNKPTTKYIKLSS